MFPQCLKMVSKCSLGPKRLQTDLKHVYSKSPKKFSNLNFQNGLFSLPKLAHAELPLKKWPPRSKIRVWKFFGGFPINMFEVCLESFGTQRTLRNHFRTFWDHLELIFRAMKKIIFFKNFSNFLALEACIFAWKCLILAMSDTKIQKFSKIFVKTKIRSTDI